MTEYDQQHVNQPEFELLNGLATTPSRLEALLETILRLRMSPACYWLVRHLVQLTPSQRLRYNLNQTMKLMHTDQSIGLNKRERQVLMEIDASGAPLEVRRTAHSLLDLVVRQQMKLKFGGVFKDRWERVGHRLIQRPLDKTVQLERYNVCQSRKTT